MSPMLIVSEPDITRERIRFGMACAVLTMLIGLNVIVWTPVDVAPRQPVILSDVTPAHVSLGAYICRAHGGIAAVTVLESPLYRFRCRTGTVIIEQVTLRAGT